MNGGLFDSLPRSPWEPREGDNAAVAFSRKYELVRGLPEEEQVEIQALCAHEGHAPELTFGDGGSKFVASLVCRCARCHQVVEWEG